MVGDSDKEKAEKLAAAKKRYEELKKQKGRKGGASTKKQDGTSKSEPEDHSVAVGEEKGNAKEEAQVEIATEEQDLRKAKDDEETEHRDAQKPEESEHRGSEGEPVEGPRRPSTARHPSMSLQSRMRSESFRASMSQTATHPGVKSPATQPSTEQQSRIEELERDNKRLQKVASENEARWRSLEEQLEEAREGASELSSLRTKAQDADVMRGEMDKLKAEMAALQRQNAQLQSQKNSRKTSNASPSTASDDLVVQLAAKSSTIESMELDISNLRAELASSDLKMASQSEQITALETSLARITNTAESAQRELTDLKKNLERATERLVREGSELTSASTRITQVEALIETANKSAEDAKSRAEASQKKVEALTTLHRESEQRYQGRLREHEKLEKDSKEWRTKLTRISSENARLREENHRLRNGKIDSAEDGDTEGRASTDDTLDEGRQKQAQLIRELEAEVFDLRRGFWRERRTEMQGGPDEDTADFQDVDLSGPTPRSFLQSNRSAKGSSSFQEVISSGLGAFMGGGTKPQSPQAESNQLGSFSEVDEDDFSFDENAFRRAQEEEGRQRVERVKEVKRSLPSWKGWRIDMVDVRRGVGWGEIFDV